MSRKKMWAALAVVAVGLSVPGAAQAGGGFGHGGFHGGWGHGGHWHGGGFWPGFGIGAGLGFGAGYYGYPYGGAYYYGPGPGYYDDGGYGGCYVVRKRVKTPAGWRVRKVDVCE
jgi:hypothetical protein